MQTYFLLLQLKCGEKIILINELLINICCFTKYAIQMIRNFKNRWVLLFLIFISVRLIAQKPPVDTALINSWPAMTNFNISDNGNYVSFMKQNIPEGSKTLVVKSKNSDWSKEIIGVSAGYFSKHTNKFIYLQGDTLILLTLGTNAIERKYNVSSIKFPYKSEYDWMMYILKGKENDVTFIEVSELKEFRFKNVTSVLFNSKGNIVLLEKINKYGSNSFDSLMYLNLVTGYSRGIWCDSFTKGITITIKAKSFDSDIDQLVFNEQKTVDNKVSSSIWYFREGMDSASLILNDSSLMKRNGFTIGDTYPKFFNHGQWILFEYIAGKLVSKGSKAKNVDIWSYKNEILHSDNIASTSNVFLGAISISGNKLVFFENAFTRVVGRSADGNFFVLAQTDSNSYKGFPYGRCVRYWLFSCSDMSRELITVDNASVQFIFSPFGRYLIYFDSESKNYFSYEIESRISRNITKGISGGVSLQYDYLLPGKNPPVGIGGWIRADSSVIIYDNFDVWKVCPLGNAKPVSITNQYGRLHHMKFRCLVENSYNESLFVFEKDKPLYLTAFNEINMYNGFYRVNDIEKGDPILLEMGPYNYYCVDSQLPSENHLSPIFPPIKSKLSDTWIVRRTSVSEAPTYFVTDNFKDFKVLESIQPQKKYNWLTAELITWKQFDGNVCKGVLYKPEDFDTCKKYPIIFNYYEQLSYRLFEFPKPDLCSDNINIPWFVSRGYLVFIPDIHYGVSLYSNKVYGEYAYNSVISAALYLSKRPWIDKKRMAIQGHSFGGSETIYLLTHSHLFAAAAEAAGVSDILSSYLSLTGPLGKPGGSRQNGTENGQGRMGTNFWLIPDLYMRNLSILRANFVTTPLLMMHNRNDVAVPWGQGIELFLALRRLGKKVWMLQYNNAGHSVFGNDALDYTIRLNQFFDYYLKSMPPPKWMVGDFSCSTEDTKCFEYDLDFLSGDTPL